MSKSKHLDFLSNHCRVCGKLFGKRTQYNCKKYSNILKLLGVNPKNDTEDVHPTSFCNGCYLKAKRASAQKYPPIGDPLEWMPHSDSFCTVCDGKSKGGRPKKLTSSGRPSLLQTHIHSVACSLPKFTLQQIVDTTYNENITCNLCNNAVNDPVELPCRTLVCTSCILAHLNKEVATFSCPGCLEEHNTDTSSFSQLSPVVEKMLLNMIVRCGECHQKVKLLNINKNCVCHINDQHETLTAVAKQPLEASPTQLEKQVATNVLSRLFHQNSSSIITLPSNRQVSTVKSQLAIPLHCYYHL